MSQKRDMGHPIVSAQEAVGYAEGVTVRVLYFGILKDFAGVAEESMHVDVGSRVGGLVRDLAGRSSKPGEGLGGMLGSIAVAVNREYAGMETVLNDGDEVALLPPVSGGCFAD